MASLKVLTDRDVQLLKDVIAEFNRDRENTANRPNVPENVNQAPEVYVALTPQYTGIPALTGRTGTGINLDIPGKASCSIFKIIPGNPNPSLMPITGFHKTVYNLSFSLIPGDTWITVVRTKDGQWVATSSGGGGNPTCTASIVTDAQCIGTTLLITKKTFVFNQPCPP